MPLWVETALENQRLQTSLWATPLTKSLVEPSTTRAKISTKWKCLNVLEQACSSPSNILRQFLVFR